MTGSNDVNPVSESMSSESKTLGSESVSWLPDTPSQMPTWTTSVGEKLTQMGTFIETEGARALLFSGIIILCLNILFTYGICYFMVTRQDGMQRIGWSSQAAQMNGIDHQVYIPVFIKNKDLEAINAK